MTTAIRVLHFEDDPADAQRIHDQLQDENLACEIVWVRTGEYCISALQRQAFDLARDKYPAAKVFGITTSLAVMKINSELGYKPVTFSELTQDDDFWNGCQSCPNHDILQRCGHKMCLCTGMLAPSKLEELEAAQSVSLVEMILKNEAVAA